jgi:DNA-binding transcriptional LysR family regulator
MTMENSQLKGFLAVVEEGGVSRAAAKLHLTQPAVTKQIQALERELKTVLFDRTGRGVELTATGALLYDYSRRSLALLEECQQAIADTQAGAIGRLIVGAGTTTCIFELPRWLQALRAQLPGIDVVVRTGNSREILQLVLAREVDLGLITTVVQHPELQVTELFEEEIVLVTSEAVSQPAGNRDASDSLLNYPLILFPQSSGFREYLDQSLIRAGLEMQVKMETDSLEAIKSFVTTGLGSSFLPMRAVEVELATGVLKRVTLSTMPVLKRQTSVVWRSDRHLSPGAKALLKILPNL